MDISPIDLINIQSFTTRIIALNEYRSKLSTYLGDKMNQCAPNLTALIGNQVRHLLFNVVLHTSVGSVRFETVQHVLFTAYTRSCPKITTLALAP